MSVALANAVKGFKVENCDEIMEKIESGWVLDPYANKWRIGSKQEVLEMGAAFDAEFEVNAAGEFTRRKSANIQHAHNGGGLLRNQDGNEQEPLLAPVWNFGKEEQKAKPEPDDSPLLAPTMNAGNEPRPLILTQPPRTVQLSEAEAEAIFAGPTANAGDEEPLPSPSERWAEQYARR